MEGHMMSTIIQIPRGLLLLLLVAQFLFGFASEQRGRAQHEPSILEIEWSVDGNLQAIGYWDYTVEIRDVSTGQTVRTLEIPHYTDIAWSPLPHPELLAVGHWGGILIFDVTTGNVVTDIRGPVFPAVTTIAWSPDGTRLAAGHQMDSMTGEGARGISSVWDATGQFLMTFDSSPHLYRVNSVAWSPDGTRIASAGIDGVMIWNTVSGVKEADLEAEEVRRVSWSPDGGRLIAGGLRFSAKVWDGSTYQFLSNIEIGDIVEDIAWRPDGQQIALLLSNKLRIIDGNTYEILYDSPHSPVGPRGLAWSPDGSQLVYGLGEAMQVVSPPPVSTPTPTPTETPCNRGRTF